MLVKIKKRLKRVLRKNFKKFFYIMAVLLDAITKLMEKYKKQPSKSNVAKISTLLRGITKHDRTN